MLSKLVKILKFSCDNYAINKQSKLNEHYLLLGKFSLIFKYVLNGIIFHSHLFLLKIKTGHLKYYVNDTRLRNLLPSSVKYENLSFFPSLLAQISSHFIFSQSGWTFQQLKYFVMMKVTRCPHYVIRLNKLILWVSRFLNSKGSKGSQTCSFLLSSTFSISIIF